MRAERHSNIRAIERGLAVLQVINRYRSASLADIAQKSRVPYPTVCRIVQTLVKEGMVERHGSRRYRPTALVQTLSLGYEPEDKLAEIARPHLAALTAKLLWPVYVSCRVGMNMVVKESTDALTSLTFNRHYPGYTMPLLESSSGRVYLAFTPQEEQQVILTSAFAQRHPGEDLAALTADLAEIRRRGYATISRHSYTENPGKTSAISVPILYGDRAVASLSILFFASAMEIPAAVKTFLEPLRQTAQAVSTDLGAHAFKAS